MLGSDGRLKVVGEGTHLLLNVQHMGPLNGEVAAPGKLLEIISPLFIKAIEVHRA